MAITINGDGLIEVGGTSTTQGRVRLAEDTDTGTNYIELTAPSSVTANRTMTFPDATTTVVGTDATQTLTNKTLTSPTITGASMSSMASSVITSGTAVASTSGTSIDFTGIPSWAKRITVMFNGVSTNGTSIVQVQIGSGSVTTSGYSGSSTGLGVATTSNLYTSGLALFTNNESASAVRVGQAVLTLVSGNIWTMSANISLTNIATTCLSSSTVTLSGTLDRVRITTVNGTDTFDAGSINILYE